MLSWVAAEEALTSEALTVRAQTIDPNDDGSLLWDVFFPQRNVDSVKLREILTTDFRPVSDRREWNAQGRLIPLVAPQTKELEMVPIESYFKLAEREIQELEERTIGNQDIFRQIVRQRIPDRSDDLVRANFRRMEMDALKAWALGTIDAVNPTDGTVVNTSYGIDATRYITAGTAWDGAVNAYDELLSFIENGIDRIGPVSGVVMRLATFKIVQGDAPNPFTNLAAVTATRSQVEQRIQDDIGAPFRFYIIENSLDEFDDGGVAYTRTKTWAADRVALVPQGVSVGEMAMAPVARAFELARNTPGAGINLRGQTVYHNVENEGKSLTVAAQVNAMPVLNEQRIFVIDAGV